ncbi:unnamed protein product [Trichobilharzia regenti]|nr:unnamed protein product [Trichobilharzia regenti]
MGAHLNFLVLICCIFPFETPYSYFYTTVNFYFQILGFDVVVGDILQIPYCSNRFDFFICIAVIHHLSTLARRIEAVKELARILRVGGEGLIQNGGHIANLTDRIQSASKEGLDMLHWLLVSNPKGLTECPRVPILPTN